MNSSPSIDWSKHDINNTSARLCADTLYTNLQKHQESLLDGSVGPIKLPFSSGGTGFLLKPTQDASFRIYIWNGPRMVATNEIQLQSRSSYAQNIATVVKGIDVSKSIYKKTLNDALTKKLKADPSPAIIALCMLSGEEVAVHAAEYIGKFDSVSEKAISTVLMYGEMMENSEQMLFLLFKHLLDNNNEFPKQIF